jgi:membrane-associated phospholipid phosphatase
LDAEKRKAFRKLNLILLPKWSFVEKMSWRRRLLIMSGILLLHSVCYYFLVRVVNEQRPPSEFLNLRTVVDNWIPYLGWTWFFYYFGDLYIVFFAAYVVWKLPEAKFLRSAWIYTMMIISGALLHIALPSKSPWPVDLTYVQHWFHSSVSLNPYACLPSMHVALTILPACISLSILKPSWLKGLSITLAALIAISTITLKEHYFLDTLAGVIFALIFYLIWRLDFKALFKRSRWS